MELTARDLATLLDALYDAYYYRLGDANDRDDPDLDPEDRRLVIIYGDLISRLEGR